MAEPELRRDSTDSEAVRRLQELLQNALSNAGIQLSAVDGLFGPITEASVKYLQQQNGLPETGVVDDATWAVLLGGTSAPGSSSGSTSSPTTLHMRPINVTTQYQLQIDWDLITLQDLNLQLSNFNLTSTPNAQLHFLQPVGKLFGAGGIEVVHREVQSWPNWFVDWSTRATVDWAKGKGLQLGLQNDAELGLRPLRGVTIKARGDLNLTWEPMNGTGSIKPAGSIWITIDILKVLPH
jgi:peptidoglycan hydrolase-like protein with peptidoglycan-binding domain